MLNNFTRLPGEYTSVMHKIAAELHKNAAPWNQSWFDNYKDFLGTYLAYDDDL